MSIWSYNESSADIASVKAGAASAACQFCSETLKLLERSHIEFPDDHPWVGGHQHREVRACPVCGWWTVREDQLQIGLGVAGGGTMGAMGVMRQFNIEDKHAPIEQVRDYLAAKYDDGIDVILDGEGGSVIGIQVKRYAPKNTIQVDQIRELAGALELNGMTRGIFVTTSSFQSGAATTAER